LTYAVQILLKVSLSVVLKVLPPERRALSASDKTPTAAERAESNATPLALALWTARRSPT